ncbi:MAG: GNAT family N-acetyltransferase [Rhodospirillaceae bacterium]
MCSSSLNHDLVIEELSISHDVSAFSCGKPSLDVFLTKFAISHPKQGLSRTWVAVKHSRIVAFYSLSFATVTNAGATIRVAKGTPRHDLPVILLARLAVDQACQRQGLGSVVLEHALRRCVAMADAAQEAGAISLPVRAVLVHALDEEAAGFYEANGLERSPTDPLHLMAPVKDLKKLLA